MHKALSLLTTVQQYCNVTIQMLTITKNVLLVIMDVKLSTLILQTINWQIFS